MATVSGDLSTGLLAYWKLDETSGTREDIHSTYDLTANGTGGVGYGTGKIGNTADFESGDSDYLTTTATIGAYNDTFSYSFWVNFESLPTSTNFHHFINHQIQNGTSDLQTQIDLYNSSGTYQLRVFHNNQNISYNWSVSTATWYHIVAVVKYNTASTGITLYINGSSVATGTSDIARSLGTASSDFSIGRYYDLYGNSLSRYFDGLIDEVGVWNTELTSGNVTTLYNSGTGIPYSSGTITKVKTFNTIANASIKTLDTIAKASLKTVDTIGS